ncbi:unnamed protein product [Macrosiphum euphorbiae]|nr:unnamed protein product [Macrosiphum euphorbiae]
MDSTTAQESAENGPIEQNEGSHQTDEREKNLFNESPANQPSISGTQKKRMSDPSGELDAKMLKFIDHQIQIPRNEENRHLSFFRGLLPSMSSLNEDQILEFQAGVMSLLQNIKKKTSQYAYNDQHNLQTPNPMQNNYPWPNYEYYNYELFLPLPQQRQPYFQNITVHQPTASPESVISAPVSVMSTTSQESEEYDFADII